MNIVHNQLSFHRTYIALNYIFILVHVFFGPPGGLLNFLSTKLPLITLILMPMMMNIIRSQLSFQQSCIALNYIFMLVINNRGTTLFSGVVLSYQLLL